MKYFICLFGLVGLFLMLTGCATSNINKRYVHPDSEMGRAIARMDQAEADFYVRRESAKYLETAQLFVAYAQSGNLGAMLKITSSITLNASGRSNVKSIYETQVIPEFKGTTVRWDKPKEIITDDTGNRGYVLSGQVTGRRSFPVWVTVMKERGKFRVITLSQKR